MKVCSLLYWLRQRYKRSSSNNQPYTRDSNSRDGYWEDWRKNSRREQIRVENTLGRTRDTWWPSLRIEKLQFLWLITNFGKSSESLLSMGRVERLLPGPWEKSRTTETTKVYWFDAWWFPMSKLQWKVFGFKSVSESLQSLNLCSK